jgi:tetratricopeptide (TPR) repeat protein
MTAAQRRAAEVAATRAPRAERDPAAEREKIEGRTLDVWIDEGASDVRNEAAGAAARASTASVAPKRRRENRPLDPDIATAIQHASADRRRGERLVERMAEAQSALDRDRLDEARRLATGLVREVPGVAAVHELAGLVAYRLGRWRDAVRELEAAQLLKPRVDLLPVLADSYRALKRWTDVDRIWTEVRELSPSHDIMAEARIVAAGAQADRGDLTAALATMASVTARPKRVREHHLRQWYVLGDLNDRAGNPIEATRWFEHVAREDPEFVDVTSRLRSLGR